MLTTLSILSMDQGKIYKDWTLEIVDDTPWRDKSAMIKRIVALSLSAGMMLASAKSFVFGVAASNT